MLTHANKELALRARRYYLLVIQNVIGNKSLQIKSSSGGLVAGCWG